MAYQNPVIKELTLIDFTLPQVREMQTLAGYTDAAESLQEFIAPHNSIMLTAGQMEALITHLNELELPPVGGSSSESKPPKKAKAASVKK